METVPIQGVSLAKNFLLDQGGGVSSSYLQRVPIQEQKADLQKIALRSIQLQQLRSLCQQMGFDKSAVQETSIDAESGQQYLIDAFFQYVISDIKRVLWDGIDTAFLLKLRDSQGMNIFFTAIREGKKDAVLYLIEQLGKDLLTNLKSDTSKTALHIAAIYGQEHLIEDLTREGLASCMDEDHEKLIPLHWSIHEGHVKTTEKLLAMTSLGREWIPSSSLRISSLALAIASGSEEILSLLLKCNAFKEIGLLDLILPFGTVIHLTIQLNQSPMLKYLLEAQHQDTRQLLETKDPYGRTPLQLAAFLGDLFAIQELVQKNCLIHQGEHNRFGTALHFAVKGEKPEAISLLLSLRADSLRVDDQGKAPLAYLQKKPLSPSATRCKNILENYQRSKKLEQIYPADFKERAPFNVIFEGTADRKEPFIGAIQALESKKIVSSIRRFSGLGMGSIIATLLSIGYKSFELEELPFDSLDHLFQESQEEHSDEQLKDLIAFCQHLKNSRSYAELKPVDNTFCNAEQLKQQLEDLIKNSTTISHLTFGELSEKVCIKPQQYKHLHLAVFSLKTHQVMHISSEDPRFKELIISDVLAASLAFPGIFHPVTLSCKNHEGSLYKDAVYGKLIAPFKEVSLVDLFDDSSYQEDPSFKERKTNYRTLSLQMNYDLDELSSSDLTNDPHDLFHGLIHIYTTSRKHVILESFSRGRVKTFSFSSASLKRSEEIITKSQQQMAALFSLSKEIETKPSLPLRVTQGKELTPWKYDLFFIEASSSPKRVEKKEKTRLCNLPDIPLGFTGRESELEKIKEAFNRSHKVAITGIGGVGKSTLSVKYGHLIKEDYKLIHFIKARSQTELIQGVIELAELLGIQEEESESTLQKLKIKLQQITFSYLLIIDGLDDARLFNEIDRLIPSVEECKILVTTRVEFNAQAEGFSLVRLSSFSLEEAVDYFSKVIPPEYYEKTAIEELSTRLGNFPLALTHAARYISEQKISSKKYKELFDDHQLKLFEARRITLASEEETVLTTWNISLEAIKGHNEGDFAQKLLEFISLLAKGPIPFDLLMIWNTGQGTKRDELLLRDGLRLLGNYAMIQKELNLDCKIEVYQIHPLLQEVIAYQLSQTTQQLILRELGNSLAQSIANLKTINEANRKILMIYGAQAENILFKGSEKTLTPLEIAVLFNDLTWIFASAFFFQKALSYGQQGLKISGTSQPHDQLYSYKADGHDLIGHVLLRMGNFEEALKHAQEALNTKENIKDIGALAIAESYYFMSEILGAQGKHKEALKNAELSLNIRLRVPEARSSVADSYEEMARHFRHLGHFDKALAHAQKGLKIRDQLDVNCPQYRADTIQLIGRIFKDLGRHQEALEQFKEALQIKQSVYGEESPYTAEAYEALGGCYSRLENEIEALNCLQKSLKIQEAIYESSSFYLAQGYRSMAAVLHNFHRYEEALSYLDQAVKINEKISEGKNIYLAETYQSLGDVFRSLERYDESLSYSKKALKLKKTISDSDKNSPFLAQSYESVAGTYKWLEQYDKALKNAEKALMIKTTLFKEDHLYVAITHQIIGSILMGKREYQKAKFHIEEALKIRMRSLQEVPIYKAESYDSLGNVLAELEEFDLAFKAFSKGLAIKKSICPDSPYDMGMSYDYIANLFARQNKFLEARNYVEKSIDVREKSSLYSKSRLLNAYGNIIRLSKCLQDDKAALIYLEKQLKVRETLHEQWINSVEASETLSPENRDKKQLREDGHKQKRIQIEENQLAIQVLMQDIHVIQQKLNQN